MHIATGTLLSNHMHIATRTLIAEQSHAHSNGDIAEQSHVHSKGVNCSELFDLEGLHQSLTGLVTDDDHGQNIVHIYYKMLL